MSFKAFIKAENTKDKGRILMYGYIGGYEGVMSKDFVSQLHSLSAKCKEIDVYVNSEGGDVFEGIAIFNAIRKCDAVVNMYIEGIAASMASVIIAAGNKVYMSKYSKLMIHKPSSFGVGDSEKLRESADLLDKLETDMLDIYASRTGKEKNFIKENYLKSGVDKWMDATEALKEKFIDAIYDKEVMNVSAHYTGHLNHNVNSKNTNMSDFKALAVVIGCEANEGAVTKAVKASLELNKNNELIIKTQKEKIDELNTGIAAKAKLEREALIKAESKRIGLVAEQEKKYLALAEKDFDTVKGILAEMPNHETIQSQLGNNGGSVNAKFKDFTFVDYQKKAPKALEEMKAKDPETYKALFKAQYGVEPKL